MKKWSYLSLVWAISLCSLSSHAQVSVKGRLFSSHSCNYYYSTLADFRLHYNSSNAQATKSVRFIVGFHNTWGDSDLADLRTVEAQKMGATDFEAPLNEIVVSERGRFAFDKLQFIVEIENLEGSKMWLKPWLDRSNYFQTALPVNASCQGRDVTPFENLRIESL